MSYIGSQKTIFFQIHISMVDILLITLGEICQGRPLEKVGAHCRDHNTHSIGICYEGGLDIAGRPQDTRTLAQRGSLLALLRELRKRFPKALIVGHHDLNPMKECPCFNCIKEYGEL